MPKDNLTSIQDGMIIKIRQVLSSSFPVNEKLKEVIDALHEANNSTSNMAVKLSLIDTCESELSKSNVYYNKDYFVDEKESLINSVIYNFRQVTELEEGNLLMIENKVAKDKNNGIDKLRMYVSLDHKFLETRDISVTDEKGNKKIVPTRFVETEIFDNNKQSIGRFAVEENLIDNMKFLAGMKTFLLYPYRFWVDKDNNFYNRNCNPVTPKIGDYEIKATVTAGSELFLVAGDGTVFDQNGNKAKINLGSVVENKNIKNINLEEGVNMPKNNNNKLVNGSEEPSREVAHPYLMLMHGLLETKKDLLDRKATFDDMVKALKADVVKMFALTESNPLLHFKKEGIELLKKFEHDFYDDLPREVHDELDAYVVQAECAEKMNAIRNQFSDSEDLSIDELDNLNTGLGIFESELVERKEDGHGYSVAKREIFDKYLREAEELSKEIEAKIKAIKEKQLKESEINSLINEKNSVPTVLVTTSENVGIIPKPEVKPNFFIALIMSFVSWILRVVRKLGLIESAPMPVTNHKKTVEVEKIEKSDDKSESREENNKPPYPSLGMDPAHEKPGSNRYDGFEDGAESETTDADSVSENNITDSGEEGSPSPVVSSDTRSGNGYEDGDIKVLEGKPPEYYIMKNGRWVNLTPLEQLKQGVMVKDITKSGAEVIVNSGCGYYGSSNGVDKKIHSTFDIEGGECNLGAEGVKLRKARSKVRGVSGQTNFVLMTNPTKSSSKEERINFITKVLDEINKSGAESAAIPLFYNGSIGASLEEAAGYFIDALEQYGKPLNFDFSFCLYGDEIKTCSGRTVKAEEAVEIVKKMIDERLNRNSVIDDVKSRDEDREPNVVNESKKDKILNEKDNSMDLKDEEEIRVFVKAMKNKFRNLEEVVDFCKNADKVSIEYGIYKVEKDGEVLSIAFDKDGSGEFAVPVEFNNLGGYLINEFRVDASLFAILDQKIQETQNKPQNVDQNLPTPANKVDNKNQTISQTDVVVNNDNSADNRDSQLDDEEVVDVANEEAVIDNNIKISNNFSLPVNNEVNVSVNDNNNNIEENIHVEGNGINLESQDLNLNINNDGYETNNENDNNNSLSQAANNNNTENYNNVVADTDNDNNVHENNDFNSFNLIDNNDSNGNNGLDNNSNEDNNLVKENQAVGNNNVNSGEYIHNFLEVIGFFDTFKNEDNNIVQENQAVGNNDVNENNNNDNNNNENLNINNDNAAQGQIENQQAVNSIINKYFENNGKLAQDAFNQLSENDKKVVLENLSLGEQPLQDQVLQNRQEEADLARATQNSLEAQNFEQVQIDNAIRQSLNDLQQNGENAKAFDDLSKVLADGKVSTDAKKENIIKVAEQTGLFSGNSSLTAFFRSNESNLNKLSKSNEELVRNTVVTEFCNKKVEVNFNIDGVAPGEEETAIMVLRSQLKEIKGYLEAERANKNLTGSERQIIDGAIARIKSKIGGIIGTLNEQKKTKSNKTEVGIPFLNGKTLKKLPKQDNENYRNKMYLF